MSRRLAASTLLLLPLVSSASVPECLLGRWRSNETMTLASMREVPDLAPRARAMFEDRFFGHLVIVFTPTRTGWIYYKAEPPVFETGPIEVVSSTSTSAVLRSRFLGVVEDREWRCEPGRISTATSKFREYFTPE